MRKILLVSIISLFTLSEIIAQGTWIQKAGFAGPARFVAAAFSIGSKGYVGTGRDGSGAGFSKDFWEWDQTNDVWTQKADFGGAEKMAAAGFSIGDKAYIATGWDISLVMTNDLWEYDPLNNTWTQKANFPGPGRYRATTFSIGTKGYLGTGYNGSSYFNDFWEWDQLTDTWTQKSNFPGVPRLSPISFAIATKGYIGTGGDGNFTANYNDFYEWDQLTDTWVQKADFPGAPRMGASAFAISCKGYVGTGIGSGATSYSDLWEYDPTADAWTSQSDYGGGLEAQAIGFSIDDKGYIGTGQTYTNNFWEFTPDSICVLSSLEASASDSAVCEKFCIDFFDQSTNNPVAWLWIFDGGLPGTSTLQNPMNVCYDNPGLYDVTLITTDGTGNSDTLVLSDFITVFNTPAAPAITQSGDTLTCSSAFSYQWQLNTVDIAGATNQSYVISQSGFYTVIVGDENGCINSTTINIVTGIQNPGGEDFISISPNPSNGNFTVSISSSPPPHFISIEIVNALGQEVFSFEEMIFQQTLKKEIQLNGIRPGIYFIRVRNSLKSLIAPLVIANE